MGIDPESRNLQGLTTFLHLVALNVLYLIACLPLVTAGAATAALYEVMLRYADEERGYLIRGFLVGLRRNLLRGTMVLLACGTPAAAAGFAAAFWLATGSALGTAAGVVAVLFTVYFSGALVHGLALAGRYDDAVGRVLRNALLLPVAEPLRTGALLLRPVATVSLWYVFPPAVVLLATIGFSVGAYLDALILHGVYRRRGGDPTALDPVSPHSGE
ncbi:YesL family protein [Myceligenerans crystallogenes]|uniref:Membrane protein YesL n=1 Tax=Myceligenerans crystallogenes TaxID=316335 RepID=A0ABN2NFS5_9MICO